ncbi:MAG: MotA/TolQ/ExbB proton channel family protein, partial [Verrucomicrobiales bacterium]|nr:MotA/TolQ/ExbB proton channel family protein [Verrucomicrobiales bacterium]
MPPVTPPSPGLSFALHHTTAAGWVIIGLLALLSICSAAVLWMKLRQTRMARDADRAFLRELRRSEHPLALVDARAAHVRAPARHVYQQGCRELCFYLLGTDAAEADLSRRLQAVGRITPTQMGAVRDALDRAVGEAALKLEGRMSIVATALSGAPFLGLLGTVWGVMDSFGGLATAGPGAGIQALAPGLSAAMLTTVAGLLVAIPSMFGYNYLVAQIRDLIARLEHFAADFACVLDRHFVDHHRQDAPQTLPSLAEMGAPHVETFFDESVRPASMPT